MRQEGHWGQWRKVVDTGENWCLNNVGLKLNHLCNFAIHGDSIKIREEEADYL